VPRVSSPPTHPASASFSFGACGCGCTYLARSCRQSAH
jgi:hypothetical protein